MKLSRFLLIALLSHSCSQNQGTPISESKKEINNNTLPRIKLKFDSEEQVFSIHAIPEFDTSYLIHGANCTKCAIHESLVYTHRNNPRIIQSGLGGFTIDTSFQGILISYPKYKKDECYSIQLNIQEYLQQQCENRNLLPVYKGKPCHLKAVVINGYETVISMDTNHKSLHSMSVNIITDSAVLLITGFWKKNNSLLKNKIIKSIYSFK